MKTSLKLISFLFILNFALSGCAGISARDDSKDSGPLEPSIAMKFSDIPVPANFKLLAQDSYTFESAGVRVGVLKYRGKANADKVVNFYKQQMPLSGWELLNVVEYGDRLMNFVREAETCIIALSPRGSSVIITASIGPKPQIPAKTSKEPVK